MFSNWQQVKLPQTFPVIEKQGTIQRIWRTKGTEPEPQNCCDAFVTFSGPFSSQKNTRPPRRITRNEGSPFISNQKIDASRNGKHPLALTIQFIRVQILDHRGQSRKLIFTKGEAAQCYQYSGSSNP